MNVTYKIYNAPPVSEKEILRYAGGGDDTVCELLSECLTEAEGRLSYKVCRTEVPVVICGNSVDMSFAKIISSDLSKNLSGCSKAVIFAATVGPFPDRMVMKYGAVSPAKALLFQAIGAERIEALCDIVSSEYDNARPRFSPGYGDLPLELQRDIFALLDCPRKIGLTLNESLLMSPTKSVTAIIGIK